MLNSHLILAMQPSGVHRLTFEENMQKKSKRKYFTMALKP